MGLALEIKKKSKHQEAPLLTITQAQRAKLIEGKAILMEAEETRETYLVRIKSDKVGTKMPNNDDLEIEKITMKKV